MKYGAIKMKKYETHRNQHREKLPGLIDHP